VATAASGGNKHSNQLVLTKGSNQESQKAANGANRSSDGCLGTSTVSGAGNCNTKF